MGETKVAEPRDVQFVAAGSDAKIREGYLQGTGRPYEFARR